MSTIQPVRFDKQWFNPLYFILNDLGRIPTIRTIYIFGGKSSAKTASICQWLTKELVLKSASSIAFRKESAKIPTTLKKSFILGVETTRLYPAVQIQDRRLLADNKAEIVLSGMDDEEKAKGIESYMYCFKDELNQYLPGEFRQIRLSLRGKKGQKIIAAWNPVDENSWVKELLDRMQWSVMEGYKLPCEHSFVKISSDGKSVLIKTTYEDNFWITGSVGKSFTVAGVTTTVTDNYGYIDENLIAEYEAMRTENFNSYKVNVLGEWGKTVFGGEFLKCWRSEKHTGFFPYDPEQAIYLSFDENVNPYFPCGFFQVGKDDSNPRMIHAIAAENPNNTVDWMCREIERKLTEWKHDQSVFICGDSTSVKDDVKQEKKTDLFRLIIVKLKDWKPTRKVRTNPSVRQSADFFNSILEGNVKGMSFGVAVHCRKAIIDFENCKEDKNGKVDKKTVTHPVTKVKYQPYGHFVDLTRYFLCGVFTEQYNEYIRGVAAPTSKVSTNIASENSY